MKNKIVILNLFLLLLSITSCNNNDDTTNEVVNDSSIIGTWKISRTYYVMSKDNSIIEAPIDNCQKDNSTYEFKSDGKYIGKVYEEIQNRCSLSNYRSFNWNYQVKGNILRVIDNDGDEWDSTIQKLNQNQLIVYEKDNLNYDGDNQDDFIYYEYIKVD